MPNHRANRLRFRNPVIEVAIASEPSSRDFNAGRLRRAVELILADANVAQAAICIAIVDDETIQLLNRRYLQHDYPTDVLSFVLERDQDRLDGEIVVSADHARRASRDYRWSDDNELLLYVIHGALHLVGYDDRDGDSRAEMRRRERHFLLECGAEPPPDE